MPIREEPHVIEDIPFSLDRASYDRKVRMDAYPELEDELDRYLQRALGVVAPRAMVRVAYVSEREGHFVEFGGERFESEILAENLEGINRVFAYVATCGPELYDLDIGDLDPFASFWHDTLKTLAVRAAATHVCDFVRAEYGIPRVSSMNPGSGDVDIWPIDQQKPLFRILGNAKEAVGVELTESSLMIPDKSVSGIFFASERAYVNCHSCTREICPDRRAPYKARA